MYQQDSLFTLSAWGQAGVLAITLALSVGLVWLTYRIARGRCLGLRLAIPPLLFILFVSLAPQAYYLYYLQIFEGLPLQWVTKWPDAVKLLKLVSFQGQASLSDHGKGVLFWALMAAAALSRSRVGASR